MATPKQPDRRYIVPCIVCGETYLFGSKWAVEWTPAKLVEALRKRGWTNGEVLDGVSHFKSAMVCPECTREWPIAEPLKG